VRAPTPASTESGLRASFETKVFDAGGAGFRTLRATELTRGGMFVHADGSLPAMFSRLKLVLLMTDGEFPLKAEVVRHVTAEQSKAWNMPVGFGVQFVELTPAQRDDLGNLMKGLPRWQSAVQRVEEKDDPRTEELLAGWKKRGSSHYELLGAFEDIDFLDVRVRAREARKSFAEARARPSSPRQREQLDALDKRLEQAATDLGQARNRLAYDAQRSNWKGVARCIAGGVSVSELDAARKRFLATHERVEGTAHLHFTTASAWESQREYAQAQLEYEKALALDPLNLSFHQRYQALRRVMAGGKKT
jgi:tetratricopeptide (TPR) repeat protein